MRQLLVLIGPPGSGKTTMALKYPEYVRVSRDDQGQGGQHETFNRALLEGKDILIDKMNFNEQQRQMFVKPAREAGYSITYRILFVPKDICMSRMEKRVGHPTITTTDSALDALHTFFFKFEYPILQPEDVVTKEYYNEEEKQTAIICDLDGTLCNIDHRLHHVRKDERKKRNWPAFFQGIPGDKIKEEIAIILNSVAFNDVRTIYCSGRGEEYREVTETWLGMQPGLPSAPLFMRPKKDYRDDALIKEIILDFEILPRYNVLFALDDRDRVVRMWRRRGITCLQCAPGDF